MKQTHRSIDSSTDQVTESRTSTYLHGDWLKAARGAWVLLTFLLLLVAVASQPASFAALRQPCLADAADCNGQGLLTVDQIQALPGFGLELSTYAWSRIVTTGFSALLVFVMGGILFWRRSDDWMVLLTALLFTSLGAAFATNALQFGSSFWSTLEQAVFLIQSLVVLFTLALFPNGRFVPRWTLWIVLAYPASVVCYLVLLIQSHLPEWMLFNNPVNVALWFGCWAILTLAQLYRYFRVSTPVERQQTKWVAFTFFVVLVLGSVGYVTEPMLLSLPHNGFLHLLMTNLAPFLLLSIPLSIGIAILRYRLWDIDIIIKRTLVYGALTACIVGIYILVVGYLGALFRTGNNLFISLIAAGLVAVLFQPLRIWLQRGANRLFYGQRDEPYAVITALSQRLQAQLAPDGALPTIVETVAQALKLPYAAILLKQDNAFMKVASYGKEPGASSSAGKTEIKPAGLADTLFRLPLVHQHETIGTLLLAPRARDEGFTPADVRLLQELTHQVSLIAHAILLASDLQHSNEQLRMARAHLVTTREEERRRLRRDLHDGLGSALTSVTFQLDAASNLLDHDPQAVKTLLKELKTQVQASLADIRRLVYNLRPPILDEWGLVAALREQVAQYQLNQVQVTINAPESLPTLPAAVEVAAYRIALEALANVIRHAQASTCTIRLEVTPSELVVEIQDNGTGLPLDYHAGVGISAMRERAAELGGSCALENANGSGTRVCVRLPFLKE